MTRFKELKRIDRAVAGRDLSELRWARAYCDMRLKIATRQDHAKHWRNLKRTIEAKLGAIKSA